MAYDGKRVPSKMTEKESEQMRQMFNWMDDHPAMCRMTLTIYKQYQAEDKHRHTIYKIHSDNWEADTWVSYDGEGKTLLDAMKNFSESMS